MLSFYRAHGLGNDYFLLDTSQSQVLPTPAVIRLLCHRHLGIGSDGVLLRCHPSTEADFGLRIYNPDGSEAEKSGNGLRIFARYLYDMKLLKMRGSIETRGGIAWASVHPQEEGRPHFSVDMGRAEFRCSSIPVRTDQAELIDVPLPIKGFTLPGTAVSIGNPHWVTFVEDALAIDLLRMGPRIETHPWFPNRTNVQFAQVLSDDCVRIRIWERGAGVTLASGSSACAVVAAGVRSGRLSRHVNVKMDGGNLHVDVDENFLVRQRGPVSVIATGQISDELEKELENLSQPGKTAEGSPRRY